MILRALILFILINLSLTATLTGKILDARNAEPLIGASIYLDKTEIGANISLMK